VPSEAKDAKQVVADGYDRMGERFSEWNSARPSEVRWWFLGEVLARLALGSTILELGCGPGTDAKELVAGFRYTGVDLSAAVQAGFTSGSQEGRPARCHAIDIAG
jgi:SAM-dependent methyltransferase